MPNRLLYTGLLTSTKVNQLKSEEFELYIRLILVADDYGRYSGSSIRVSRACWPEREDMTSKKVEPMILQLHQIGLIRLYEVDGDRFIEITNWDQRKRTMVSKYPSPVSEPESDDGQMTVNCQSDDGQMTARDERRETRDERRETRDENTQAANTHGSQSNVKLTDRELESLRVEFPDLVDDAIELLSLWIHDKGDKTKAKTHASTIRRWVIDAVREKRARSSPGKQSAKLSGKANFEQRQFERTDFDEFYVDPGGGG